MPAKRVQSYREHMLRFRDDVLAEFDGCLPALAEHMDQCEKK